MVNERGESPFFVLTHCITTTIIKVFKEDSTCSRSLRQKTIKLY
jgi:hypothetical protein